MTPKLAMKFTPDGPVPVQIEENGVLMPLPVPKEKFKELPKGFKEVHYAAMLSLEECVAEVKRKGRTVPVLREELLACGVTKKTIRELEDFRMVKCQIIALNQTSTGKPLGARAVVFFTPLGHSYMDGETHE